MVRGDVVNSYLTSKEELEDDKGVQIDCCFPFYYPVVAEHLSYG